HSDVRQRPNLVIDARITAVAVRRRVTMILVQLENVERQRRAAPRIVTTQTFRATVKMPRLPALTAGRLRVGDPESAIGARVFHQGGVGLRFVPPIRVAMPGEAVKVQDLRLYPARTARFPLLQFERERFCQHGIRRKDPLHRTPEIFAFVNPGGPRKGRPSFRLGTVAPELRAYGKRDNTGSGAVVFS